jgi:hypothetical protein
VWSHLGVGMSTSTAIFGASQLLQAGDILLIEAHRPGPAAGYQPRDDQHGYIPIEWWRDDLLAVRQATGRGIIVVAAAGNGAQELDAAIYDTPAPGFEPRGPTRCGVGPRVARRSWWVRARRPHRILATSALTGRGSTSRTMARGWTLRAGDEESSPRATGTCRTGPRTSGTRTRSLVRQAHHRSWSARWRASKAKEGRPGSHCSPQPRPAACCGRADRHSRTARVGRRPSGWAIAPILRALLP